MHFLNENAWISLKISLKFVSQVTINNIPASVQIMGWLQPGERPLSEPMMASLLMHICVFGLSELRHPDALFSLHHQPNILGTREPSEKAKPRHNLPQNNHRPATTTTTTTTTTNNQQQVKSVTDEQGNAPKQITWNWVGKVKHKEKELRKQTPRNNKQTWNYNNK